MSAFVIPPKPLAAKRLERCLAIRTARESYRLMIEELGIPKHAFSNLFTNLPKDAQERLLNKMAKGDRYTDTLFAVHDFRSTGDWDRLTKSVNRSALSMANFLANWYRQTCSMT